MQRYQVNYKLLLGILGGGVLLAGLLGGLYYYQYQRNADQLLAEAEVAREKGELLNAAKKLYMYTRRRPNDVERVELMALTFADVAESRDTEPRDRANAVQIIESTLRKQRRNDELRRRFIDLLMDLGAVREATEHLEIMVNDHPEDAELIRLLTQCYVQTDQNKRAMQTAASLVGYDPGRGRFTSDAQAIAPDEVDAYAFLGAALRRSNAADEDIDKVFHKAVEANPESAEAYVLHSRFLLSKGDEHKEEAVADADKALELDPKHLDALLLRAQLYAQDEQFDKAKELLDRGFEADPDSASLYLTAAPIANRADGVDASLEWLKRGVERTEGREQLVLKVAEARALLSAQKLEEGKRLMAELEKEDGLQKVMKEYLQARLLVSENRWFEAAQQLTKLRPEMTGNRELNEELNVMLALCYTRLEQWERVEDASNRALQINPLNQLAKDLRQNAQRQTGRSTSARDGISLTGIIRDELRKPETERDWDSVRQQANEFADEMIEKERMTEAGRKLLLAEVSANAGDFKQAASLIRTAIKEEPDNMNTWRLAVRLTAKDPDGGAVKAMRMLDQVIAKPEFGDNPVLRLDRADLYVEMNDENVIDQMLSVAEDMSEFTTAQKVQVWKGLAARFEARRANDALTTAREKIAELAPGELSNLLDMFMTARSQNDDARMEDTQKRILEVVGDDQNATYLYTEAHRLLSLYQRGLSGAEALDQAEQLVKRAQQQRPDWHHLNLLLADVAVQRGDAADALTQLDRAAELGPPTVRSMLQHVSLLMQRGRYDDARKQMDRAPQTMRENMLGRQYAESLLRSRYSGTREKRWSEAIEVAKTVGERAPEDLETQLWLGRFLTTAGQNRRIPEATREAAIKDAGQAFAKAVELSPESEAAWRTYVLYLADHASREEANQALFDMQLALEEDTAPLALAVGYQKVGRWFDALNVYERLLEINPDNLGLKRQLASFYLTPAYPQEDGVQKATPLINAILRTAADNADLRHDPQVQWARRTAAKLLAQTGDYQKALDAEKLLAANVVNGELEPEDQLTLARILATRPEPALKLRAIGLYESYLKVADLEQADAFTLGQLYYSTGQWEKCQQQMVQTISENPSFVPARDAYVRMLLAHDEQGDLRDASRQLKRLQEYAPTSPSTLELVVRVSDKLGRKQDVAAVLQSVLSRDEVRQNPDTLIKIASLLADIDQLDAAENLHRAAARGSTGAKLALASFLGKHRSIDDALDLLEQVKSEVGETLALQYASGVLQSNATAPEARHFERVSQWLDAALREDPESVKLISVRAELAGSQKDYRKAAELYRSLLERQDLRGVQRAIVLNNLAYQIAMDPSENTDFEEAIGYVAEAVDILGPRSDILDTRAVVYMSLGQYEQAVADLRLAVTDTPTASKYFHLAQALMGAQQPQAAVDAWDEAVELGLSLDDIGVGERDAYQKLEEKISRLKASAGASETAAR